MEGAGAWVSEIPWSEAVLPDLETGLQTPLIGQANKRQTWLSISSLVFLSLIAEAHLIPTSFLSCYFQASVVVLGRISGS